MVSQRQNSLTSFLREAWLEIDLASIEQNVAIINSWIKTDKGSDNCELMAVVKSDAYGHGAVRVSEFLVASGASQLAVASVDEGLQLRESIAKTPILLLAPAPGWALDSAINSKLDLTITSLKQLKAIELAAEKVGKQAQVNVKVDSGMHRLGVSPHKFQEVLDYVLGSRSMRLTSVFSHLAKASDSDAVNFQNNRFKEVIELVKSQNVKTNIHLASSEATELFPETHYDMVRVGLFLYGLRPRGESLNLKPAMSVRGRIINIVEVPEGESIGYNWTWTANRDSRVASIPIGYADGVDRSLSNKIAGFLMGKKIKQAGLISMDQMMFDITDIPQAKEGDVITLIGSCEKDKTNSKRIDLSDWGQELDTITYELACRLRARLPKVYTRKVDQTYLKDSKSNSLKMTEVNKKEIRN